MDEATSDHSERLFSLDSDDTSYIQQFDFRDRHFSTPPSDDSSLPIHADYFNGLKTQERDYYEELFTPDTLTEVSNIEDCNLTDDYNSIKATHENSPDIFIENLIQQLEAFESSSKSKVNDCTILSNSNSKLSNDFDSISSENNLFNLEENTACSNLEPTNESHSCLASSFLDDKEISQLLEGNFELPAYAPREKQQDSNDDIIACFNVRNKYEHNAAAELFIQENLSFLSIQEPFSSKHKVTESWKAFRMLELQSARIRCFETPYQVILFDTWKWGGKILYPFQSKQYGRVTSIAFDFGNDQKIGLISIYAPANVHNSSKSTDDNSSLQITTDIVSKISKKWKKEHSDIQIILLGDLQETISTTNRDNIGLYRQEKVCNGILELTKNSHESIVRKIDGKQEYITRFGSEGGRGIDHILTPVNSPMSSWITNAKVDRQTGAEFFPSDHSMISCTFKRDSQNNNEGGNLKTRYNYKKICSIKMKQSGQSGECLELDDNQFKDCQAFREQQELFHKIRNLTGNHTSFTNDHLDELQMRIQKLYTSIWEDGVEQKVDGSKNKLVDISEDHALELAYILQKLNSGVREAMGIWNLQKEFNVNDAAGKIRGQIRRKKGFKLFANLPATTKLYYLKKQIIAKTKQVKKKLYWLNENDIRNKHGAETLDKKEFWNEFEEIIDCHKLTKASNTIHGLIISEAEERSNHIEAIQFKNFEKAIDKRNNQKKQFRKPLQAKKNSSTSNSLRIEEKLTKKSTFGSIAPTAGNASMSALNGIPLNY